MTDLEREAIEFLKDGVIVRITNDTRDEFVKEYSYSSKTLILQLIQKQDTEINKLKLEHNKMIVKIITECDYMIKNRNYMNDIAIKNLAERIKDIAKFYIEQPKYSENKDERRGEYE